MKGLYISHVKSTTSHRSGKSLESPFTNSTDSVSSISMNTKTICSFLICYLVGLTCSNIVLKTSTGLLRSTPCGTLNCSSSFTLVSSKYSNCSIRSPSSVSDFLKEGEDEEKFVLMNLLSYNTSFCNFAQSVIRDTRK